MLKQIKRSIKNHFNKLGNDKNIKNLAFVPFRSGSKRVPNKNIKAIAGKLLYQWVVDELTIIKIIDRIVLAIDLPYYDLVYDYIMRKDYKNIEIYIRKDKNAKDDSQTEDVMLEYLNKHNYYTNTNVILTQATNPFLKSEYIYKGLELLKSLKYDSIVSVVKQKRFEWKKVVSSLKDQVTPKNYDYKNRKMNHESNVDFIENGSFYISTVADIKHFGCRLNGIIGKVVMPDHSYTEIDTFDDWDICELLLNKLFRF